MNFSFFTVFSGLPNPFQQSFITLQRINFILVIYNINVHYNFMLFTYIIIAFQYKYLAFVSCIVTFQ